MGQALEYQRAINAAKMQKIFSQPYLYTLNDHTDGISTMCKVRENVSKMISGSFNGEVIVWDLIKRSSIYKVDAFRNQTKEICSQKNLDFFLAAGDNNVVKLFNNYETEGAYLNSSVIEPA